MGAEEDSPIVRCPKAVGAEPVRRGGKTPDWVGWWRCGSMRSPVLLLRPLRVEVTKGRRLAGCALGCGMTWDVFTYRVEIEGRRHDVVSPIDGRWLFEHGYGLADRAIVGVMLRRVDDGGEIVPDNFRPNRPFVDFLHELLAAEAPQTDAARLRAARQREGYLYLIDGRTPDPDGRVPPEDIIGAIAIQAGKLIPGTYQRNDRHQLLSSAGFFVLPSELEAALLTQLRAACAQQPPSRPPALKPDDPLG